MWYDVYTCDVFTDRLFGGNPLAVLPDARGLDSDQMQSIARELNLSETVFVLPPETESSTCRLRIFTPATELPFAGHPTIGTAHVLVWHEDVRLGRRARPQGEDLSLIFEEGVGPVPVLVRAAGQETMSARLTAGAPKLGPPPPAPAAIAEALSLRVADLLDGGDETRGVSCGAPCLLVPLRSLEAVRRARLRREAWEKSLSDSWAANPYVFSYETEGAEADIHSRFFAPGLGIPEDPATGAAAASLAGYLALRDERRTGSLCWSIEQGIEMGRPSRLAIEADKQDGVVTAVRVAGSAVLVGKGRIRVA